MGVELVEKLKSLQNFKQDHDEGFDEKASNDQ